MRVCVCIAIIFKFHNFFSFFLLFNKIIFGNYKTKMSENNLSSIHYYQHHYQPPNSPKKKTHPHLKWPILPKNKMMIMIISHISFTRKHTNNINHQIILIAFSPTHTHIHFIYLFFFAKQNKKLMMMIDMMTF